MSDWYSLYLAWKLILLFHTLDSLAIAAVAVPIRMRISAVLVPSLDRVAPKYLKEVTVSSGSPHMMMLLTRDVLKLRRARHETLRVSRADSTLKLLKCQPLLQL